MTKEKRKRRSLEEWRAIMLDYETAPNIDAEFYAKHGLASSMLYKWRGKLGFKHARGDPKNLAKLDSPAVSPGTEVAVVNGAAPVRRKSKYPDALRVKAVQMFLAGEGGATAISKALKLKGKAGTAMVQYWIRTDARGAVRGAKQTLMPAPVTAKPIVQEQSVLGVGSQAAITLLKQAEREALRLVRTNKIRSLDSSHLLSQLALRALLGD